MSMCGSSAALASSQCCWSPRTHTENLGLGRVFSLCFNKAVSNTTHDPTRKPGGSVVSKEGCSYDKFQVYCSVNDF